MKSDIGTFKCFSFKSYCTCRLSKKLLHLVMPFYNFRRTTVAEKSEKEQEDLLLEKRGYTLGKVLGEGSFAKVVAAEFYSPTEKIKKKLACKIIDTDVADKEYTEKFFRREIEICSRINHPHLVIVHSILQRKKKVFIFMTYAENGNMLEYLQTNGAVNESQGCTWFYQIVQALIYLHDMDIAHRDMKCENILLESNLSIRVADFGFSRVCREVSGKIQLSSTFCGSVAYACPEILQGKAYDAKKSDVWSLGVILFVMLNKSLPFGNSEKVDKRIKKQYMWRPQTEKVVSSDCIKCVAILLEPVTEKRPNIGQVNDLPWLYSYREKHKNSIIQENDGRKREEITHDAASSASGTNDMIKIKDGIINPITQDGTVQEPIDQQG